MSDQPTAGVRAVVAREREEPGDEPLARHLDYWRRHLRDAPALLPLPVDHGRTAVRSQRGFRQPIVVPPAVADGLRRLGREEGSAPLATLLTAFYVFLLRHTGQADLVVGVPVAGLRQGMGPPIGPVAPPLALRGDLSGDPSFREALRRVRDTLVAAQPHAEVPAETVAEAVAPDRDLGRHPLAHVSFALRPLSGAEVEPAETHACGYDLTLTMDDRGEAIRGTIEGRAALFDRSTVVRFAERLATLIEAVVERPEAPVGRVPVMTDTERERVLVAWNDTRAAFPEACFHQLFERQADATPDAVAAEFHGEALTYAQLDRRANRLAHHLVGRGARPEARVGICLERGLGLAVAVLGIMKAGAAYVPLDPRSPQGRLELVIDDADVGLVVTEPGLAHLFDGMSTAAVSLDAAGDGPTHRPNVALDPGNLAYLIYTSGSTGTPKGIMVPHRGVCNMAASEVEDFRTRASDRVLQVAPLAFDVSIWEMAMTWPVGATLVFATEDEIVDGGILDEQGITVAAFTPSLLATLDPARATGLHTVLSVGEACTERIVTRWAPGRRLINVYGPTETTGHCATADLRDDGSELTIGRPIHNVRIYVLDHALEPVPPGVVGELVVGGPGVTRGYVGRLDLTAERFVPDPFGQEPGSRLYRTGDFGRHLPDGRIEYLGRRDDQVKVRGFRIELGEVEAAVAAVAGVAEAAVVAREGRAGDKRLVAYVVSEAGVALDGDEVRRAVRARLPAYMVPAHVVQLDRLPLNANRKLDREALPAPEAPGAEDDAAGAGPLTPAEARVARVWEAVLGTAVRSPTDDFFDLGGQSLLATRVVARLADELGVEVPLRDLFLGPTLGELAAVVERAQREPTGRGRADG